METTGKQFVNRVCKYFRIGASTRRYRDGEDVIKNIMENVGYAATLPGYFSEQTQKELASAFHAVLMWQDMVIGFRIHPTQYGTLSQVTPYQFAKWIGDMIDNDVHNRGEADLYFRSKRSDADPFH
jgi:hypothetical protein